MGLWLVLFLMEHLLVNSQAALLLGDNARGFIEMVNSIHNLPYLEAIELCLLGVPILIHMVWGIKYLLTSKQNNYGGGGAKPHLQYGRNRAFTWQRITSWILVFGLIGHVVKFRFLDYPTSINQGNESFYFIRVNLDNGLYTVADRLGVALYDAKAVEKEQIEFMSREGEEALIDISKNFAESTKLDSHKEVILLSAQKYMQKAEYIEQLEKWSLEPGQVVAVATDFGTASLLAVRDTFKSPVYCVLYTIFVLAACFHGFNGLWTFLITWGVVLKMAAQKAAVRWCVGLMLAIIFLGLSAIWGTYWFNLRT
jgi:succinate dehydrogenase / fumarate reductase cytochrome b subunit